MLRLLHAGFIIRFTILAKRANDLAQGAFTPGFTVYRPNFIVNLLDAGRAHIFQTQRNANGGPNDDGQGEGNREWTRIREGS